MSEYSITSLEELTSVIQQHIQDWLKYPVWLLNGPLGAGKTTFVKSCVHVLDPEFRNVRSPSFALVHEYRTRDITIVHADFYRLETVSLEEFGLHEIIGDERTIVVIEWADRLENQEGLASLKCNFSVEENNQRTLQVLS